MVIEDFVLGFSVFSAPQSFYEDSEEDVRIFAESDITGILGADSNFHFNRGDLNFFSQHGAAAYSFWTHAFSLSDEEAAGLNHDHDLALALLFKKLKEFVGKHQITPKKIEDLHRRFDCRCEILFIAPNWYGGGMLFRVNPSDLLFMAELDLTFKYWERDEVQIKQLQEEIKKFD